MQHRAAPCPGPTHRGAGAPLRQRTERGPAAAGGGATIPVVYRGSGPDASKGGREIVLDGASSGGVFHAKADSLVTKCPSKYTPGDADSAQS